MAKNKLPTSLRSIISLLKVAQLISPKITFKLVLKLFFTPIKHRVPPKEQHYFEQLNPKDIDVSHR